MRELQSKILDLWYAERPRWILWLPVLLGMGVGIYFGLENEPPRWPLTGVLVLMLAAALVLRKRLLWAGVLLAFACVVGGVALGAWRSHSLAAPVLERDLYVQEIVGVVREISLRQDSTRLTLGNARIPALSPEETPRYVTVSLRQHADKAIALGDTVRLRAGFFPPPQPVIPGGYAFNRHFYFQQIGATGYSPGKAQPEIVHKAAEQEGFAAAIARARHHIALYLMERMGMREGPVAAALMVGEQRAIPDDIYEAMRVSGLVHILSISGTHLSLAAGIMFFATRLLLAAIPAFAARYDGKKAAAVTALIGSFIYLLLAGSPISAQRSFVMVALVLLAVMLSRNVTPIRSLCLAGLLILVTAPESLLNPGFQLSFAATIGILSYYEYWREKPRMEEPREWSWRRKQAHFWGGIVSTSVIATLTTVPYILYHFDGLPTYSVLGNLLVLPLVSFWIMPLIVLVLLLMPFGLADWLVPLLQFGIWLMDETAAWVAALPYAEISLPPLTTAAIAVVTLGGLWGFLWQRWWRHLGWLAVAAGLLTLCFYRPPDMVVSADGKKIAVRTAPGAAVMLRGQRSGFMQDGWQRFMQVDGFGLRKDAPEEVLRCDTLGCIYHIHGKEIAVVQHRAALAEDCGRADMTLTPQWSAYHDAKSLCPGALLFDRRWLVKSGGAVFWLDGEIRHRTVAEIQGNRPWSRK